MKRRLLLLFSFATILAGPLFGGLSYDFRSVGEGPGATQLAGRTLLEGENMRMDMTKGDGVIFKDNSILLSNDSGKTVLVLDPKAKTYFEFPVNDLLAVTGVTSRAMPGMASVSVKNAKVAVKQAGDGGAVEGFPTKKYLIDTSYDIKISVMGIKNESKIQASSQVWTTENLRLEPRMFLQDRNMRTGIKELDEVIAAHTDAVKGFPLKVVTKTVTTAKNGKSQTLITTVTITKIEKKAIDRSRFKLPSYYEEQEMPVFAGVQ